MTHRHKERDEYEAETAAYETALESLQRQIDATYRPESLEIGSRVFRVDLRMRLVEVCYRHEGVLHLNGFLYVGDDGRISRLKDDDGCRIAPLTRAEKRRVLAWVKGLRAKDGT